MLRGVCPVWAWPPRGPLSPSLRARNHLRSPSPTSLFGDEFQELADLLLVFEFPLDFISVRERNQNRVFPELTAAFVYGMASEKTQGIINSGKFI